MASRHNPEPMLAAAACCWVSLPGTSTRPDACSPVPRNRRPARTCLSIPSDSRARKPSNAYTKLWSPKTRACTTNEVVHEQRTRSPRTSPFARNDQEDLSTIQEIPATQMEVTLGSYTLKRGCPAAAAAQECTTDLEVTDKRC